MTSLHHLDQLRDDMKRNRIRVSPMVALALVISLVTLLPHTCAGVDKLFLHLVSAEHSASLHTFVMFKNSSSKIHYMASNFFVRGLVKELHYNHLIYVARGCVIPLC